MQVSSPSTLSSSLVVGTDTTFGGGRYHQMLVNSTATFNELLRTTSDVYLGDSPDDVLTIAGTGRFTNTLTVDAVRHPAPKLNMPAQVFCVSRCADFVFRVA